jgi:FkbM family methyltransferase
MEKLFLDIGTHNGQTILKAIQKFPDCGLYVGVEPVNSLAQKAIEKIPPKYKQRVIIFNLALDALDTDFTYLEFYEDVGSNKLGSSLLQDKKTAKTIKQNILCMDILFFLRSEIFKNKDIILKIDIEGKEYDILEKMLKTPILKDQVSKLFIEWHWNKTKSISKERHDSLVAALNKLGYKLAGESSKDQFYEGL